MLESLGNNLFTYKKLTEEEQQSRGILGRLAGIIADTKNPTRNGRLYSSSLWENVFNDPVMLEKIENRCCFGELGHPADREEVDPEKIAICLAEKPKLGKDGKLYGIFDILNTPCGKILKSLCDYGANIGVSSRGSGDIMGNDEVDPETYYCECWDAVIVPAVKTARPKYVTESLDTKAIKLKAALRESYNAASDEDKKVMKEALDNLDINIDDGADTLKGGTPVDPDLIPRLEDGVLLEAADEEEAEAAESEEVVEEPEEAEDEADEDAAEEVEDEEAETEEEVEESDAQTIGDMIKALADFDENLPVEFAPIAIDGKEYSIDSLAFDDSNKDKIIINVYSQEIGDNIEDEVEEPAEEVEEEIPEEAEEVNDAEADAEMMESLKDAIRAKDQLEGDVKVLKSEKAVSDAKVEELTKEVRKYKEAFERVGTIASKSNVLAKEVKKLTEDLAQKDVQIEKLKESRATVLSEGLAKAGAQLKKAQAALVSKQTEIDNVTAELTSKVDSYKNKLAESININKKYKAQYEQVLESYIKFRSSMLGVRSSDIVNQLAESYTIADIDEACNKILNTSASQRSLPFGLTAGSKIKINESKVQQNRAGSDDDLSDLMELAGLK